MTSTKQRYSLVGEEGPKAVAAGLTTGQWFRADVPRKRMKQLMQRSDSPAIRDTALWIGLMLVSGLAGGLLWGTWWAAAPCFLVYGVLYGSGGDSRWHEAGHGTAFRTRWMDDAVYQIGSFMMMRNPVVFRWGHTRHHTDTLIVGRDPEIQVMRPARLAKVLANLLGLYDVPFSLLALARQALGRLSAEEATFVPEQERARVYRAARVHVVIYLVAVAVAVLTGSLLPLMYIGGPRIYGTFMHVVYGMTQHAGMGENVLDHRLNTRSVKFCAVNRFIYWNMNWHVEHHMFPMVPYHRLPELHEEIKDQLAPMYPSIWAAYKEIVPAVLRQLRDPSSYVHRELPERVGSH
ncbi:MAG TPA: fatty acid desaturase family protein [Pseudonocardia sp.]|nr:fatty acid desaturase family protein [Pseudonocardia sp.]